MLDKTVFYKHIRKWIFLFAAVFCMILCFHQPASAATKTSVKTLAVGESYTIKKTSKVKSSKTSVASAKKKSSAKYKITGKKKGASTLSVYNKNGKLTEKVYLLVYNNKTFVYDNTTANLAKGKTKTVKASTNKSGVTVKYKSSDTSIATVSSKGKITAKKAGKTTVKALFYYKGTKVKTIKKTINVYTSSYNTDTISLAEGKTKTVSASFSNNCSVKYSSSDTGIASVNSNGKITAKKAGTAIITAKISIGKTVVKTYTKKVKVTASASSASAASSSGSSGSGSSASSSSNTDKSSTSSSGTSSGSSDSSSGYTYSYSRSSVSIAGGKSTGIDVYTDDPSAKFDFKINGDNIAYKSITEGYLSDGRRYINFNFYARIAGSCEIKIYRDGSLVKTIPVTVTSTDTDYFTYESWRADLEKELWTNGMSSLEKIKVVGDYVFGKYPYSSSNSSAYGYAFGEGGDCWASTQLIIDLAHDLGLQADAYFTNGLNYGHVVALIIINGVEYYAQNTASSSSPYGYCQINATGR